MPIAAAGADQFGPRLTAVRSLEILASDTRFNICAFSPSLHTYMHQKMSRREILTPRGKNACIDLIIALQQQQSACHHPHIGDDERSTR